MKKIRVAMLAPPWLPIPPEGYGGIENVLSSLVPELEKLGVHVELFATGDTTIPVSKLHYLYEKGQYDYIHRPQYDSMPITVAHLMYSLDIIRKRKFDIIHDHNGFLGPMMLANSDDKLPPAIHTLHGPPFSNGSASKSEIPDNTPMWEQFRSAKKIKFVGVSEALTKNAPYGVKKHLLEPVHNAVNVEDFPFVDKKQNYFITLARFHPDKGHHIAAKAAVELGERLKMAGVVQTLTTPRQLMLQLVNPLSKFRSGIEFRYYSDKVFPLLEAGRISYVGEVKGERKMDFISKAKGLLFPINWDEPFGMAVVEALACGTPVVAMNRGAMPEIIEHGVNGFLAENEREFKHYMTKIDEIEPAVCRESIERKFSAQLMAKKYLERYKEVIEQYKNS